MFKIQTLNPIATIGLSQLPSESYDVATEMSDPDAILVRSHDMLSHSFHESLKVVGRAGTGVNNIPVSQLTSLGIPVLNAVGANANAVKELVIAGMLMACRNLCQATAYLRELKTDDLEKQIEHDKKQFIGFELQGKTLGIIGLGSIGVKVANTAMNLGMHVIGYDPTITVNRAWELSSAVQPAPSLEYLLRKVDFLSLHVPLTDATKNMLQHEQLKLMKENVIILNFARDGILNQAALESALNERKILAYVTDFPSTPLKNHPRVISLPHLGASTKEAEENCAVMIVKQIRDYLELGNIVNSVNFPTIEMPFTENTFRLAIVNENVPNIVAQISSQLGAAGLNIVSLLNGSREQIAYTLIDVNSDLSERLIKDISKIKGIVRIRRVF
jgi:D-3-phosphoglycerate dehydrogenase